VSVHSTPLSATAIVGTDLVGCTVRDLQKSLAFYRDTLGLIPSVSSENGVEFHLPDGSTFGLWQPPEPGEFEPGFGVMFTVADAASAAKHIRERGGTSSDVMEGPTCNMAVVTDNEGHGVMMHQKKSRDEHRPPAQERTPTTIHGIDMAGYLVAEPQGAIAFYRDVLGLVPTDVNPAGRGAEFELADGSTFGVWRTPDAQQCGFVMFAIDDARTKAEELRARGLRLTDLTETPNCFMAFGPDPEGTAVIIHQRKGNG